MHIDNVDLEHFPTNEVAQRLLTYVTRGWYDKSYVGKWIYEVIGLELETASRRISEAQKQAFPETAAWGMYFHELMYGIPIDRTKDIDDRRKAVVNRRDRTSRSSITPYRLENIIQTVFGLSASVLCVCQFRHFGMHQIWLRLTLPGSCPPSTISAQELNFCVRNGNRCILFAIITT